MCIMHNSIMHYSIMHYSIMHLWQVSYMQMKI